MALSLLHTSDWHIGKPFGRLDEGVAGILRHARLKACDRLAAAARASGARIVLVAGDVYDRPSLADRDLRAPLAQMAVHTDLAWHIIPGNHDPATAGGVWERVLRLGLPPNVTVHLASVPVEIAPAAWLLPAPLSVKSMSVDPTAWMDAAATPPGAFRIGLAHGSVQGFGSEQRASIEIAPDRAKRAGLAYLALGDWHGYREIGPRTAYCGTPEPDGYLDNEQGLAIGVTLDSPDGPPRLLRHEVGEHRWIARRIDGARTTDIELLQSEFDALGARALQALLSVEVEGRVTVAEERALKARLDGLESKVMHLDVRLDRLVLAPATDDVDALPEGGIRDLALELSRVAGGAAEGQQAVSGRALRFLFDLTGQTASAAGETP